MLHKLLTYPTMAIPGAMVDGGIGNGLCGATSTREQSIKPQPWWYPGEKRRQNYLHGLSHYPQQIVLSLFNFGPLGPVQQMVCRF